MRGSHFIRSRTELVVGTALMLLVVVLLVTQLRSLFVVPLFDSYLWWGDESWLMLEFKQQIATGRFAHPFAQGASIYRENGVILGNMWATAALYGGFAQLGYPLVETGRVISAIIGIGVLVVSLTLFLRHLRLPLPWALLGLLLFAETRIFLFTSHSARYDMLSLLAVIAGLWALSSRLGRANKSQWFEPFALGALLVMGIMVSVHVPLLLALPVLYFIYRKKYIRDWKSIMLFVTGGVIVAALLLSTYYVVYGHFGVFGTTSGTAHQSNLLGLPILRPFSRSVQAANVQQKFSHLFHFAPIVLALGSVAVIGLLALRKNLNPHQHSFIVFSLLTWLGWLMLESGAPPSYTLYAVFPLTVMIVVTGAVLPLKTSVALGSVLALALLTTRFGIMDATVASRTGRALKASQQSVFDRALAKLELRRPRVLVQAPFMHLALGEDRLVPMAASFIDYPPPVMRSTVSTLRANDVRYLMLVGSPLNPEYMREIGKLRNVAERYGEVVHQEVAPFTDIMRPYFESRLTEGDTLTLYRFR